jgi:sec-independent protein translocase protein TatA
MAPVIAFLDPLTLLVLGAIAVMLYGERLPEVAKAFGKGLMELKNGVRSLQDEIQGAIDSAGTTSATTSAAPRRVESDDRETATAPKFEPPRSP